ncbi:MAG: XdhC family protein [Woeseiaceae bacterium]
MNLLQFFDARSSRGQPMVLATVYETVGSTYSKAGGQMLIDSAGNFCGMLSGGCLEGDLVERARRVIESGVAETASYDLGADDELWGLGVGCDGTMRVLLQLITRENTYQPFAAIADIIGKGSTANMALVISTETSTISVGASLLSQDDGRSCFGIGEAPADAIEDKLSESATASISEVETTGGRCTVLFTRIAPPPAMLVLGAGPDAEPVVRIADELGWRCTVCDHRPTYIESRRLPRSSRVICCPVEQLAGQVVLDEFDLAIVMSHHLASDRSYLRQIAVSTIGYVGLLGPIRRRERLVTELGDEGRALRDRLHGPAGIDLGGRGPGPIALSIIAEMQQYLNQRD